VPKVSCIREPHRSSVAIFLTGRLTMPPRKHAALYPTCNHLTNHTTVDDIHQYRIPSVMFLKPSTESSQYLQAYITCLPVEQAKRGLLHQYCTHWLLVAPLLPRGLLSISVRLATGEDPAQDFTGLSMTSRLSRRRDAGRWRRLCRVAICVLWIPRTWCRFGVMRLQCLSLSAARG
jgi:hypothetical protein